MATVGWQEMEEDVGIMMVANRSGKMVRKVAMLLLSLCFWLLVGV